MEFGERIEVRACASANSERVEHIDALSEAAFALTSPPAPPSRRMPREFPFRIDDERGAFVKHQIGLDQGHALAGAAAGDRHHMPVVVPPDDLAGALAEQKAALRVPGLAVHFLRLQPARGQSALDTASDYPVAMPARQILAQRLLECVIRHPEPPG